MSYIDTFRDIIRSAKKRISNIKPSAWAEKNRVMTSDVSAMKGKFSYWNTPYTKEIADCAAPDHPARKIAVKKGAQIGFSAGVIENIIGWIIDQMPGNIMYLCGSPSVVKTTASKIDKMIDSSGIRSKIKSTTKRVRNTKSGDTDKMKEFPGGYLKIDSTSHKSLRAESYMYGFIDDFESMIGGTKESGATTKMIEQRFAAYGKVMKLFYISTPEIEENSNIDAVYELGDKRKYHIPCPDCGEKIEWLFFGKEIDGKQVGGIKWDLDDDGDLIEESVRMQCYCCGHEFDETNKMELINKGEWIPSDKPSEPGYYSYHINALVAPVFMYGWIRYVRDYMKACPPGQPIDEKEYHTFVNLVLGECYKPPAKSVDTSLLQKNIRDYDVQIIPEEMSIRDGNGRIVMVTCGVDMNGKLDDARIDYEVVAYSESGATYSIDHGSFGTFKIKWKKPSDDRVKYSYRHGVKNSVWPLLENFLGSDFVCDHGQRKMKIMITALDSGHESEYAYQFMDTANVPVMCIKGEDDSDNTPIKMTMMDANLKTYRNSRLKPGKLFLAENNFSKDILARHMELKWDRSSEKGQPEGFMNFPTPSMGKYSKEEYFSHFAAEEKQFENGKFRWKKKKGRVENHLFDCRLYANIIKDIFVDGYCKEMKIKDITWSGFVSAVMNKKSRK